MLKGKKKKSPWIPPPGRTHHHDKTTPKNVHFNVSESRFGNGGNVLQSVSCMARIPEYNPPEIFNTATSFDSTADMKNIDDDTFDLASLGSVSSSGKCPNDENAHLRSIKEKLKLFAVHFRSLKRMSLFLKRYFITHEIDNNTIRDLNERIDDSVRDIIFELDELEYTVSLVENTLDPQSRTEEYLKMVKSEENLLSKLLDCYSKAVTIFEAVLQKHSAEEDNRTHQNREILERQLQISDKKCDTQSAMIKDLQRRLSILQGKANTVESYKSTLEDTRAELLKQLTYKEAQIKYLSAELLKQSSSHHKSEDNEELLEIIEKVKKNAQAEKTALKKALKVQKSRTETAKETVEKLTRDLKERDKIMFSLASQRDQLKLQLTLAKNYSIEGKTEKQEIKIRNKRLQEELCDTESSYKTQLKEIENSLKEKTAQLNEVEQDNKKLQQKLEDSIKALEVTTNELNSLKSCYSNADVLLSPSHGDGIQENALGDVKHLISLLKDTKDCFNNIKTTSVYTSAIEDQNAPNMYNMDSTQKSILNAVEEIKEHLLELKDICDCSNKPNGNTEQERKFKDLQKDYDECTKQNELLKSEIEELKTSKFSNTQMLSKENIPTYIPENEFSTKSLQLELRLKTEENWRIKQREKDLEKQLEEVKDKLQKKEMENIRLFSVEEELKVKKNELSLLELKKEEEAEKSRRRMGELQESLDKVTTEYESLKRYVQVLKSSYMNVFGGS